MPIFEHKPRRIPRSENILCSALSRSFSFLQENYCKVYSSKRWWLSSIVFHFVKFSFTSTLHLKLEPPMHIILKRLFMLLARLFLWKNFHLELNLTVNIFHRRRVSRMQYNEKRDKKDALDVRFNCLNSLTSSEKIVWNMVGVMMS